MKQFASLLLLLLLLAWSPAQAQQRPRIGLTLSGGGARGLAHIGLLKALDSAQVRVDYVTGTSMGAIVGALYAAGYSGAEIERIGGALDWPGLLTNAAQLRTVTLPEKDNFSRYAVELPFAKGAFQLPNGVIESEELWLKLSELFFPYYRTKDFDQLQRPFRCVATDVISGEPVVLGRGEIVSAIRASMAIPSIFTPVRYQNHRLVDGGIVRNFPVTTVKALGADYVIGSNVSAGAYTEENLRSAVDVMLQISSFKDNADFKLQKALCDLYVDYPLGDTYSSGSFGASAAIIELGVRQGRALYPRLRTLSDSLTALYGPAPPRPAAPRADSVYVGGYEVRGVAATRQAQLLHLMRFRPNRYYTAARLSEAVRNAFGTLYFRRITYDLVPTADSTAARIVFDVRDAPPTTVGVGLHYNSLTGIGLIGSVSSNELLLPYSTSQAAVNIGDNLRLRLRHLQYLTGRKNVLGRLLLQGEQVGITTYDRNFDKAGLYKQRYLVADGQLLRLLGRNRALGAGTRYEYGRFRPDITSRVQLNGRINQLNSYLTYQANTLDAVTYPRHGHRLDLEAGYVYAQHPRYSVLTGDSVTVTEKSPLFSFAPYPHLRLHYEQYVPLTAHSTLLGQLQVGVNLNYHQAIANDFVVGGLSPVIRNQVTFAGLPEASIFAGSAAVALLGYRYFLTPTISLTAKANSLYHGFVGGNARLQPAGWAHGGALTLGVSSPLGPIDASLMYSNVTRKVLPYFNIGIPFGYR